MVVSCVQDIAANGAFSLGMFANMDKIKVFFFICLCILIHLSSIGARSTLLSYFILGNRHYRTGSISGG